MTARYDRYLSYSGFTKFQECPQSYYLEYIQKKRPKVIDERNTLNGNTLHNLMEEYIENGVNRPEWLRENLERVWHETADKAAHIVWRHDNDAEELRAKARKWTDTLATMFEKPLLNPERLIPELKTDTIVQVGDYRVKMGGRLDIVLKGNDGKYMFLDLKASESKQIKKFDQIVWYAVTLSAYLDDPEQPQYGGYVLPGLKEMPIYEIPDAAKRKLLLRLEKAMQKMDNEEWAPIPEDRKCFWCNVKHACPVKGAMVAPQSGQVTF